MISLSNCYKHIINSNFVEYAWQRFLNYECQVPASQLHSYTNCLKRNYSNRIKSSYIKNTPRLIPIITPVRNCANDNYSKHEYHDECERAINEQILSELNAAYAYLCMASYFGRSTIALPGCYGYFVRMHQEEMGHAHKLIKYQNMRGGRVRLSPITCTDCTEWDIKKALEVALEMEKLVKEKLEYVYNIGETHRDLNLMDMITTEFISEQEKTICELSRLITRYNSLCGCKCGCSEFLFDKHMHSAFIKNIENEDLYKLDDRYK